MLNMMIMMMMMMMMMDFSRCKKVHDQRLMDDTVKKLLGRDFKKIS